MNLGLTQIQGQGHTGTCILPNRSMPDNFACHRDVSWALNGYRYLLNLSWQNESSIILC